MPRAVGGAVSSGRPFVIGLLNVRRLLYHEHAFWGRPGPDPISVSIARFADILFACPFRRDLGPGEGTVRREREITASNSLFGNPLVAAALGALVGVLLTLLSRWSVTKVTPVDPLRGMAVVTLMMGARFAIALVALGAYFLYAHEGLVMFGIALAISFVSGLLVEAFRMSVGPRASSTSA